VTKSSSLQYFKIKLDVSNVATKQNITSTKGLVHRRTYPEVYFLGKYTSVYVCRWTRCLVDVVFGPVATHECVVNA
jgi:hypothetical protein